MGMNKKLDLGDPHEEYSFAALVRRNPAWMAGFGGDFVDTIPTDHGQLDDPRLDAPRDRDVGTFTGLAWALPASAAIVAVVALAIAYFV
jgi:hypothetical protein